MPLTGLDPKKAVTGTAQKHDGSQAQEAQEGQMTRDQNSPLSFSPASTAHSASASLFSPPLTAAFAPSGEGLSCL